LTDQGHYLYVRKRKGAMGKNTLYVRLFCLVLITALLMCSCSTIQETGDNVLPENYEGILLPFESDGKWGYISPEGNVVIEPVYAYAGYFSEGMAIISDGRLYGYINERNQTVVPPKYSGGGEFRNGYAPVSTGDFDSDNMQWGFIDKSGREIIRPRFLYAENFSPEGRALVWIKQEDEVVRGFVNTKGEVFIPDDFEICSGFSDGLALIRQNGLYGYIDAGYSVVIPPRFQSAGDFGEGRAYAETDGEKYIIDKSGNIISKVEYPFGTFSDGFAVFSSDGLYGYVGVDGNVAIKPRFAWARDFSNGLAAVQVMDGNSSKWGFIDTSGRMVIDAVYDEVEDFIHDYVRAYKYDDVQYYILDKNGRVIHSGKYRIE